MKTLALLLALSLVLAGCTSSLENWRGALSVHAPDSRPYDASFNDTALPSASSAPARLDAFRSPQECLAAARNAAPALLGDQLENVWLASCDAQSARESLNESFCLAIWNASVMDAQARVSTCVTYVARTDRRPSACDVLSGADRAACRNAAAAGRVYAVPELNN